MVTLNLGLLIGALLMVGTVAAVAEPRAALGNSIVVESAKSATLNDLVERLSAERLVYVGETHTSLADHELQLEVLRAMAQRPQGLALGVEWFQTRFQPVLDAYLAGSIDEAEMLRRTEYYSRWRFDYRLYRDIVRFARDKGIPIIALNADREVTDAIRQTGLDGLDPDMRAQAPGDYDFSNQEYEAALREMFRMHQSDDSAFQRFLEVQLTWDESMAARAAAHLERDPGNRILVLAGRGHVSGRHGIPSRVTRRTGIEGVTIGTFQSAPSLFKQADLLVLAEDVALPTPGLMRVLLDERDDGVYIKGFTTASPAEKAGAEKGDLIVALDGTPIRHYTDIKIAMLDKRPGDEVDVQLRRDHLFGGPDDVKLRFALVGNASPH